MSFFRYRTSSGELYGESIEQWPELPFGQSQVDTPTDNRTIPAPDGGFWIFDGSELRDATSGEIAGFQAATDIDDELRTRAETEAIVDIINDHQGKLFRAFADILKDEINTLRQQFNTTTAEVSQLTTTTFTNRTLAQLKTAIKNRIAAGD